MYQVQFQTNTNGIVLYEAAPTTSGTPKEFSILEVRITLSFVLILEVCIALLIVDNFCQWTLIAMLFDKCYLTEISFYSFLGSICINVYILSAFTAML